MLKPGKFASSAGLHTERGEVNIGQSCREAYGSEVALIGFATHSGTVAAASEWDAPMEIKTVLLAQIAKSIPWSISDGRGDIWRLREIKDAAPSAS